MVYLTKITVLAIAFTIVDPLLPYDVIALAYVLYPLIVIIDYIKRVANSDGSQWTAP